MGDFQRVDSAEMCEMSAEVAGIRKAIAALSGGEVRDAGDKRLAWRADWVVQIRRPAVQSCAVAAYRISGDSMGYLRAEYARGAARQCQRVVCVDRDFDAARLPASCDRRPWRAIAGDALHLSGS